MAITKQQEVVQSFTLSGRAQRRAGFFEAAVFGLMARSIAGQGVQGRAVPWLIPKQPRRLQAVSQEAAVHPLRLSFSYSLVSVDQILLLELTSGYKS